MSLWVNACRLSTFCIRNSLRRRHRNISAMDRIHLMAADRGLVTCNVMWLDVSVSGIEVPTTMVRRYEAIA